MTTVFYYADVVPSDDYLMVPKALLLMALVVCFFEKKQMLFSEISMFTYGELLYKTCR